MKDQELDLQCKDYCYDVVKSLLDHARVLNKQSEYNEADTLEKLQERMDKESLDFLNSMNDALQKHVETNNVNTFDRLDNIEKLLESVVSRKIFLNCWVTKKRLFIQNLQQNWNI